MAPSIVKKRKIDDHTGPKPAKKVRKQQYYSSPSSSSAEEAEDDDEFPAVNLADSDSGSDSELPAAEEDPTSQQPPSNVLHLEDASSAPDSGSESNSDQSSTSGPTDLNHATHFKKPSKRNDPAAFASSMSAILSSKLSSSKRNDPVLARSTTAAEANASIANSKLESKARSKIREDKKAALEKGRVKDVLLGTDAGDHVNVGAMMEEEKRLRKTAQRGVVKLFNAVRQAQVRAEEARRNAKGSRGRREEKVGEMSKKGFLELVAGGGAPPKGMSTVNIEEA